MKLIVTIPAYNEEKTIAGVIKEIPVDIDGIASVEIIVVDDGSTDGTVAEAMRADAGAVVRHMGNKGLGVTFRDGLDIALQRGADIIVNIDADGQYNALEISSLIKPILMGEADIVLGWRDINRLDFMPRGKKIGNKLATWLTRQLTGIPIKDAQTGFRAFSREAALRLTLFGKYTYVQEVIIQASYKEMKIVQVPIEFRAREGKSRLIPNLIAYATRAGSIIFSTYRDYHPLQFFGFIGGIIFLIGLGFGIGVLVHFSNTGMVSPHIPSAILASLLIITGLGIIIVGVFVHMLNSQRKLIEEILYRLKKTGSENGSIHHPQVSTLQRGDGKSSF